MNSTTRSDVMLGLLVTLAASSPGWGLIAADAACSVLSSVNWSSLGGCGVLASLLM